MPSSSIDANLAVDQFGADDNPALRILDGIAHQVAHGELHALAISSIRRLPGRDSVSMTSSKLAAENADVFNLFPEPVDEVGANRVQFGLSRSKRAWVELESSGCRAHRGLLPSLAKAFSFFVRRFRPAFPVQKRMRAMGCAVRAERWRWKAPFAWRSGAGCAQPWCSGFQRAGRRRYCGHAALGQQSPFAERASGLAQGLEVSPDRSYPEPNGNCRNSPISPGSAAGCAFPA